MSVLNVALDTSRRSACVVQQSGNFADPIQPLGSLLCFPYHPTRILVIAQPDEFRVTQVIRTCPLQKLDFRDGFRLEPDALQHHAGKIKAQFIEPMEWLPVAITLRELEADMYDAYLIDGFAVFGSRLEADV